MGVSPESPVQQDLFDVTADQYGKARALDEALDRIGAFWERPCLDES